jgi:hypothetical protein
MIKLRRYAPGAWRVRGSSLLCVHTGDGWELQPTRGADQDWLERTGMETFNTRTLRGLKDGLAAVADDEPFPAYNDQHDAVKLITTDEGYVDITGLVRARKVPYPESSQTWWEIRIQVYPAPAPPTVQYAWSLDDVRTRIYEIHLMLVELSDTTTPARAA